MCSSSSVNRYSGRPTFQMWAPRWQVPLIWAPCALQKYRSGGAQCIVRSDIITNAITFGSWHVDTRQRICKSTSLWHTDTCLWQLACRSAEQKIFNFLHREKPLITTTIQETTESKYACTTELNEVVQWKKIISWYPGNIRFFLQGAHIRCTRPIVHPARTDSCRECSNPTWTVSVCCDTNGTWPGAVLCWGWGCHPAPIFSPAGF